MVTKTLIENSESDMRIIMNLKDQIKQLTKSVTLDKKTEMDVKRKMYDDFQKEIKKTKLQYKRFKSLAQIELRVKDQILETTTANMERMMIELKSLKTVLHVPRLRAELKNYDFKENNFTNFLKNLDELTYDVKK